MNRALNLFILFTFMAVPLMVFAAPRYVAPVNSNPDVREVHVDANLESDIKEFAPSKVDEKLKAALLAAPNGLKKLTLNFPVETARFYSVMGAFAVADCVAFYKNNPAACNDYFNMITDPLGYVSFYNFILANHATAGFGELISQSSLLAKTGISSRLIWGNLGMAAGSIASSFTDEMLRDPHIRTAASLMWRKKTPQDIQTLNKAWQEIEKKWFTLSGLAHFGPEITALIGSAMTASVVTKIIQSSLYSGYDKATGRMLMKPWITQLSLNVGKGVLSSPRLFSGPGGIALFLLADKIVGPPLKNIYQESKFSYDQPKVLEAFNSGDSAKSVQAFGAFNKAWREHLLAPYNEKKAGVDRTLEKFYADIETTIKFYSNFLENKDKIRSIAPQYHTYNLTKALNANILDWGLASKFTAEEANTLSQAAELGLKADFIFGIQILPGKLIGTTPTPTLKSVVDFLKPQNDIDKTLYVEALNAGIPTEDVFQRNRSKLQNKVAWNKTRNIHSQSSTVNFEPLINTLSKFEFSNKGPQLTLQGIKYRTMAEKLLASMVCGPELTSDIFTLPIFGLGQPMFNPPRLAKLQDGDKFCKYDHQVWDSITVDGAPVSLPVFISKRLDFTTDTKTYIIWLKQFIVIRSSEVSSKFDLSYKSLAKKYLKPVLTNGSMARPVQNLFQQNQQLPAGVFESQKLVRQQLLAHLEKRITAEAQAQLKDYIDGLNELLDTDPAQFKVQGSWQQYIDNINMARPEISISTKKGTDLYGELVFSILNDMENILLDSLNTIEKQSPNFVNQRKQYYLSILGELSKLAIEFINLNNIEV